MEGPHYLWWVVGKNKPESDQASGSNYQRQEVQETRKVLVTPGDTYASSGIQNAEMLEDKTSLSIT